MGRHGGREIQGTLHTSPVAPSMACGFSNKHKHQTIANRALIRTFTSCSVDISSLTLPLPSLCTNRYQAMTTTRTLIASQHLLRNLSTRRVLAKASAMLRTALPASQHAELLEAIGVVAEDVVADLLATTKVNLSTGMGAVMQSDFWLLNTIGD